jgi:tight adherence protein C
MLALATFCVFLSVTLLTTLTCVQLWVRPARSMDRLGAQPRYTEAVVPSLAVLWRELVEWAGSFLPASPRSAPLLRRRLTRAGFRHPSAVRRFRGLQALLAVLLGAVGALAGWDCYLSSEGLWMLAGAASLAGYLAPMRLLLFRIGRRRRAVERGLPNALDLMVVCVESGLGLDQTIVHVAHEMRPVFPEIAEEFTVVNLELRAGKRRAEALHDLGERTGVEDLKKLVAVLIQADRFGTGVSQSLRGHSDYMRAMARERAEEKAAKIAVKLVFPIFFCILPSLFVVTVGPVAVKLVRDLIPMIENM